MSLAVFCDGSYNGDSKKEYYSYGIAIYDNSNGKKILLEHCNGTVSNICNTNYNGIEGTQSYGAEYVALFESIQLVKKRKYLNVYKSAVFYLDNKSIVDIVSGHVKGGSKYQSIYEKIKQEIDTSNFKFQYIERSKNGVADSLSKTMRPIYSSVTNKLFSLPASFNDEKTNNYYCYNCLGQVSDSNSYSKATDKNSGSAAKNDTSDQNKVGGDFDVKEISRIALDVNTAVVELNILASKLNLSIIKINAK